MTAALKQLKCGVPSGNAIKVLEAALEDAKSGKLLSVAVTWTDRDSLTHTQYAVDSSNSGRCDLVAGVALLQHRLVQAWNEG
jgi:hypothetical protein